jgi:hypothetical protein
MMPEWVARTHGDFHRVSLAGANPVGGHGNSVDVLARVRARARVL